MSLTETPRYSLNKFILLVIIFHLGGTPSLRSQTTTFTPTQTFTSTSTLTPIWSYTPTPVCGFGNHPSDCGSYNFGPHQLIAYKANLSYPTTIVGMSVTIFNPSGPVDPIALAVYSDSGGYPGTLLTQSNSQLAATGWNSLAVTPVFLPPGDYWLAILTSSSSGYPLVGDLAGPGCYYASASSIPSVYPGGASTIGLDLCITADFCSPVPTDTPPPTPTGTLISPTMTTTNTWTITYTPTPTNTFCATCPATNTFTPTFTRTNTGTPTNTFTPGGPTATPTPTNTAIPGINMVALGPAPPPDGVQSPGASNIPVFQFKITNPAGIPVSMSGLTLTASGTGNDWTGLIGVNLYLDVNQNGVADAGDVLYGGSTYSGDNGNAFISFNKVISAGTSATFLVTYTFSGTAPNGTYQIGIASSAGLTCMNTPGTESFVGLPLVGATINLLPGTTTLTNTPTRTPTNSPTNSYTPCATCPPTNTFTPTLAITVATPDPTSTFTPSYTGSPFPSNTATFTPTRTPTATPTNSPTNSYTPCATCPATNTYTPTFTNTSTKTSTNTVTPGGPTVTPTSTPLAAVVSLGANSPSNSTQAPGAADVPVLQFQVLNTGSIPVSMSAVTVTASGTGNDATGINFVGLYLDANQNGLVDGSDVLVGNAAYTADNGKAGMVFYNLIAPAGTATYLVTLNFSSSAGNGTYQANILSSNDIACMNAPGAVVFTGLPLNGAVVTITGMTMTPTFTNTPCATCPATNTFTPTRTYTFTNTNTSTRTSTPTGTWYTSTPTNTPIPTDTFTPTSTPTISFTPTNTLTPTVSPSPTSTGTSTNTPTGTWMTNTTTNTVTQTVTNTVTKTYTPTFTYTNTNTRTFTYTATPGGPSVTPTSTTLAANAASGPAAPPNTSVVSGIGNVPVLQFQIHNPGSIPVSLSAVTITASGTGNDLTGIASMNLYLDTNQNGVVDGTDVMLGSTTFSADNGTAVIGFYNPLMPGATDTYLVTYDFANPAPDGTYQANLLSSSDLVYMNAPGSVIFTGLPLAGAVVTIGPLTPIPTDTPTDTFTPSVTPTGTWLTSTPTRTSTNTFTPTPTRTFTSTNTTTPTAPVTLTATLTATNTITPTAPITLTATSTSTPVGTPILSGTLVLIPGTTQYFGLGDGMTIISPAGSFTQPVTVTVSKFTSGTAPATSSALQVSFMSNVYVIDTGGVEPLAGSSVTIILPYNPADIPPGYTAADLTGTYFDGTQWVALTTSVDSVNHLITVVTDHFSWWAAVVHNHTPTSTPTANATSPISNSVPVVFPNPAAGNSVQLTLPFLTAPSEVTLRIYTVSFRKVRDVTIPNVPVGSTLTLDLLDKAGARLSNGFYYLMATTPGGGRHVVKLIVAR